MKQYEYKIADIRVSMGFDEKKKVREAEEQWNALGGEMITREINEWHESMSGQ